MKAPIRLAATGDEFARALVASLAESQGPIGGRLREERLAFARRNDWDRRFESLQREIAALVGPPQALCAGGRM